MARSDYAVVSIEPDALTIRDLNCGGRSVTNDAEAVVAELRRVGLLPMGRRLYYYDSQGELDEIVVDERGSVRIVPGPRRRRL